VKTDAQILDWLEESHTLHREVEVTYVVDGYEVEILHDGTAIFGPWHGETLREAYSLAMDNYPGKDAWPTKKG
jgi:hypothetical protein